MTPVAAKTGSWDTKVETLEAQIPYQVFKKLALSRTAEIQVGNSSVELREKNLLALKDLNSRVLGAEKSSVSK
jgi:hypothetical protein